MMSIRWAVLAAALLATPGLAAAADPSGLFGVTPIAADEDLATRVAALGTPSAQTYRRGPPATAPYRPAADLTRDQTSPFGLEVLASFVSREVEERVAGTRFAFDVESTRLLLKATFRLATFFEVYGLAGIADLDSPFEDADFDGDFGAAFGGGARLTFFRNPEWFDTTVFVEGRYLQYESDASGVPFEAGGGAIVFADQSFDWREWEGRVGASWRFYLTRPYVGLRYSDAEADSRISITPAELDLRAVDNVGAFLGIDIYFDPDRRVGLNLEASFPDQPSVQAGLKVWF